MGTPTFWFNVCGVAIIVLSMASLWFGNAKDRDSNRQVAELQLATQAQRERADNAEARLLDEQRLTAKERWRLERLERAVLPRSITPAQRDALRSQLQSLGPVNVAMSADTEPTLYGLQFVEVLNAAHALGKVLMLPNSGYRQSGVVVYAANDKGHRIADVLHAQDLASGLITLRALGLEQLPADENTIIVGANNAAWSGGAGQPGEGLDEHGNPVPAPR
jgi:hypothetical protein